MDQEHLQRIEELYHAAREREPGERAAFLKSACEGDEELRSEVQALLAQDVVSGLLEQLHATVRSFASRLYPNDDMAFTGSRGGRRLRPSISNGSGAAPSISSCFIIPAKSRLTP